jgi:lipid A 3-O-deacylase
MKIAIRFVLFSLLACASLLAQAPTAGPAEALRSPGWNWGLFIGGSQSFANTPSAHSLVLAGRFGRVLTHEIGQNALRGSFEMAVDIIPLNEFWIHGGQYAGGIDPFIAKWNFTGGQTVSPYIAAVGGILFSTKNLPPGDTSQVNFTSGGELGLQWFVRDRQSLNFSAKVYHLSNASLGNKNPGINGAVQFMLGYTWY